ncbi:MAG: hypothetical protein PHW01_01100 [Patescibacteria group bacterium]|nr:hypothetical protein [Patescibacteria group bacterium]
MFQRSRLEIQNTKLLISNPKVREGLCNVFIFEPERGKENLGELLILVKIEEDNRDNREIAQGIVEIVKNEFYRDAEKNPEENLEASLVKINEILKELASLGKVAWVGKLDAIIACLQNKKLILTQTGKALSLLVRDGEASFITEGREEEKEGQPLKTFKGLTFGLLESNDHLILSTATLFDFFSPAKLIQILCRGTLKEAKNYLEELLKEQIETEMVGTILVSLKRIQSKKSFKQEEGQLSALEKIGRLEDFPEAVEMATEEAETQTDFLQAVDKRLEAKRRGKFPFSLFHTLKSSLLILKQGRRSFFKYAIKILQSLWRFILFPLLLLLKKIFSLFPVLWKKLLPLFRKVKGFLARKKIKTPSVTPIQTNQGITTKLSFVKYIPGLIKPISLRLQAVPLRSKIILSSLIVALLFLASGIIFLKKYHSPKPQAAQGEETILQEAEGKRKAALDAMVYKDEKQARELLEEADSLTGQILGSSTHREEAESLKNAIVEQFDKMDNITRITEPALIFNVDQINSDFNPLDLIGLENGLYALCNPNNIILRLDPQKKEAVQLSPSFNDIGYLVRASQIDQGKNILFVNADNKFSLFDFNSFKIEPISAESPLEPNNIQDLAEYSNKIYTLNPSENQIVKYTRTIGGLSKGSLWLSEGDIKNGASLAIDGDAYVLTLNGEILKFRAGKQVNFNKAAIQPALEKPTKIFTRLNDKNLYLVDPPTRRIIVLGKNTSEVLRQFTSDKFNDLKDIWVAPDEKIIYVLAGKSVYQIENR